MKGGGLEKDWLKGGGWRETGLRGGLERDWVREGGWGDVWVRKDKSEKGRIWWRKGKRVKRYETGWKEWKRRMDECMN